VTLRKVRTNVARAAFTLMEMLVVVAIIVMLAGLSTWGYMRYLENAKAQTARATCIKIAGVVEAYKIDTGSFPGSLQELTVANGAQHAYLEPKDIIDPWGRPFNFDPNAQTVTGRPKVFTTSSGTEINNW
jgi:general secretion pathway protein G